MFRNIALIAASALTLTSGFAIAAGEGGHIEDVAFAHEGPFGKFDQFQLQRGLQVYTEVCAACHGPEGTGDRAHRFWISQIFRDFLVGNCFAVWNSAQRPKIRCAPMPSSSP